METPVTKEQMRDLRDRMESLKRDVSDWTRSAKDSVAATSRRWVADGREWAVGHPRASLGILAGVAVGVGFGLGFWLGRRNRD